MKHRVVFVVVGLCSWFVSSARADLRCHAWVGTEMKRSSLLSQVEKAVRSAGESILKIRTSKDFQVQEKKNFSDLKTAGDCASQKIILSSLDQIEATRGAKFLAEEKCAETSYLTSKNIDPADLVWVLDPIDGTTNYAHGMPHFSISLALVDAGKSCLGVVYAPVYDEFFYAWEGYGAFLKTGVGNPVEKLAVSRTNELGKSLWITGTEGGPGEKAAEKNKNTFSIALELLPQTQDLRRTGSASLDLASVAAGRVEGYFELSEGLSWWDVIAGMLLVSESGGLLSLGSKGFNQSIDFVLATNSDEKIHSAIKSALLNRLRK